ncbi:hypothetical protein, partial [Gymnodinialimonas ulvae]|uniref:hypothetical protein n=1 Tax=Gymnodinialimonas ulvae TaxID=3126504 RepID=UPI003098354D
MGVSEVGSQAPEIEVHSSQDLQDAYATLSTTPGGGTIYLTGNFSPDDQIFLTNGGSNPVHITS